MSTPAFATLHLEFITPSNGQTCQVEYGLKRWLNVASYCRAEDESFAAVHFRNGSFISLPDTDESAETPRSYHSEEGEVAQLYATLSPAQIQAESHVNAETEVCHG